MLLTRLSCLSSTFENMMFGAVLFVCLCFLAVSDSKSARAVSLKGDALKSNEYSHVEGLMKNMDRVWDGRTKRAAVRTIRQRLSQLKVLNKQSRLCPPKCDD